MGDIVSAAQIQGVQSTNDASIFTMTAGGVSYTFSLNPTEPAAPNTRATIYCPSTTTW
jgi:hypothetical protein